MYALEMMIITLGCALHSSCAETAAGAGGVRSLGCVGVCLCAMVPIFRVGNISARLRDSFVMRLVFLNFS